MALKAALQPSSSVTLWHLAHCCDRHPLSVDANRCSIVCPWPSLPRWEAVMGVEHGTAGICSVWAQAGPSLPVRWREHCA